VLITIQCTDFRKQSGRFSLGEDDDALFPIAEMTAIRADAFRSKRSPMFRCPIHGSGRSDRLEIVEIGGQHIGKQTTLFIQAHSMTCFSGLAAVKLRILEALPIATNDFPSSLYQYKPITIHIDLLIALCDRVAVGS
jgi:hypothetical protein